MSDKQQLLLTSMTLCCIVAIHAFPEGFAPGLKCRCIQTSSAPVSPRLFRKIEILPPDAHCRHTEIIITKKNNATVCVTPDAQWIKKVIGKLQSRSLKKRTAEAAI